MSDRCDHGTGREYPVGYAGLFNVGVMGFAALGGLAAILVSMPPQHEGYAAGGLGILAGLADGAVTVFACVWTFRKTGKRLCRAGRCDRLLADASSD